MAMDIDRFNLVKVGEMRAALDGVHDDIRIADVLAVRKLLEETVDEQTRASLTALNRLGCMLWELAQTFAREEQCRDLTLSQALSAIAHVHREVATLFELEAADDEVIYANQTDLIDQCIATSAAQGSFRLAAQLETLRKALGKDERRLTQAKNCLVEFARAMQQRKVA